LKGDRSYLEHVLDAIERVESYTRDGEQAFIEDLRTQDAVVRNLEVIGEAVKNLSADTRAKRPEVPWREIAGMRDKMIHEYFGVDLRVVWDAVQTDLPRLRESVRAILEESSNQA
jgi:uncharacterized protein with HEPN domain